jgi:hypothetical protein
VNLGGRARDRHLFDQKSDEFLPLLKVEGIDAGADALCERVDLA